MTDIRLDPHQQQVVDHDGDPLLVLGSPGTGKTAALVERWVRLATEVTEPHRVLLLVPHRDRALELRDELPWRLPGRAVIEVPVHTWHAFAYHLVTRYYRELDYAEPPVLLTLPEQWAAVRDLLAEEDPSDWDDYGPSLETRAFVDEVHDFCVRAGQRVASSDELEALARGRPDHEAVVAFVRKYREHLRRNSRLDYAGLVAAAANLLARSDGIAARVRQRFTHVLVDDAQELAPAQLRLLRHLATDHLVCAGDPDSAIEAFRGADPTWLDRFAEVVDGHDRVVLGTCHRFGKAIGEMASSLISHAPEDGPHRPDDFSGPVEGETDLRIHGTFAAELDGAAREVRAAHLAEGIPYERMAILLAQPGAYLPPLQRRLEALGVPCRVTAGDRPLAAEPGPRAVLDLCRAALDPEPPDDLLSSVLASPLIGLDPHRVRELRRDAYVRGVTLAEVCEDADDAAVAESRGLRDLVRTTCDEPADGTFAALFDASAWCAELAERRHDDPDTADHFEALYALSKALNHFVERRRAGTMADYLASTATAEFGSDDWVPPSRRRTGVEVASFHASKGRDWDLVCVLGVSEGQIPKAHRARGLFDPWALEEHSATERALAQLAEERRTLYVALTRARWRLVVSSSPGAGGRATPSRFLDEAFGQVPEPLVDRHLTDPLTVEEACALHRRTLASDAADDEKAAAACALARVPDCDPSGWWWRRDWTPGPELTPDGKLTTSYSRIGKYDNCPLQYVLESVLGLDPESTYQMKFGSLVHKVMELADPARNELPTLEDAVAYYKEHFDPSDYPNIVFARTYYTAGVRMLKLWWRSERNAGETVDVEYSFDDLDFDGHTIRGRIDRVAKGPRGLVLTDYKTSRSMLRWEEAKGSLQLAIYYLAAKEYEDLRKHGEPATMQLVYPALEDFKEPGTPAKRYQRPKQAEEALGKLSDILAEAGAERFDPSPEADCQWCKMKPLCPRWPEGREVNP